MFIGIIKLFAKNITMQEYKHNSFRQGDTQEGSFASEAAPSLLRCLGTRHILLDLIT